MRQLVDMSLPAFPQAPDGERRLCGEVTRLNGDRQFKPFVYLNGLAAGRGSGGQRPSKTVMTGVDPATHHSAIESCGRAMDPGSSPGDIDRESNQYGNPSPKKKNPAFRRDFPALAQFRLELAISLRIGVLALTVGVLLLLAGFLAAALLLLARLLTRVLILLARILIRIRHRISPCMWNVAGDNRPGRRWFPEKLRFRGDHCVAAACRDCGSGNPRA